MSDKYVNHVNLATGEDILDLRGDTVTEETMFDTVTAHDSEGKPITGKFPASEIDTQAELISQIKTTLAGKAVPSGGSGGGENVSNTMRVTFDCDLATMQASNPSHTSTEIADAFESGAIVQGVFSFIEPTLGVPASLAAPLSLVTRISGFGDIVNFTIVITINNYPMYLEVQLSPEGISTYYKTLSTLS